MRGLRRSEEAEVGCWLHTDLKALAVMGIVRVVVNLHKFLLLASQADRYFRHHGRMPSC